MSWMRPVLETRIIHDYINATQKYTLAPQKREDSIEDWGVRNLGRTLYDLCFGIYSARVWGLHTSQISSKQAQRVAKLNLKNVILRTLGIRADPATYFTKYMYPRKGISVLFENMAAATRTHGGCVRFESPVVRLERDPSTSSGDAGPIRRVVYRHEGSEKTIDCDGVLS